MKPVYRFACLFLLFGLSADGTVYSAVSEAEAELKTAEALVKKRQFRDALPYFDRAAKLAPSVGKIFAERGSLLLGLEEREKALDDLNRAIQLDPSRIDSYVDRARCQYELQKPRAAIEDVTRAINLEHDKPNRAFRLRERASYYFQMGNSQKAFDDLGASLTWLQDYYTYFLRGDMHYKLKQYRAAVADYTIGLKLVKPNVTDVDFFYEERARAYDKLGETSLAQQDRRTSRIYSRKDPFFDYLPPDRGGRPQQ